MKIEVVTPRDITVSFSINCKIFPFSGNTFVKGKGTYNLLLIENKLGPITIEVTVSDRFTDIN